MLENVHYCISDQQTLLYTDGGHTPTHFFWTLPQHVTSTNNSYTFPCLTPMMLAQSQLLKTSPAQTAVTRKQPKTHLWRPSWMCYPGRLLPPAHLGSSPSTTFRYPYHQLRYFSLYDHNSRQICILPKLRDCLGRNQSSCSTHKAMQHTSASAINDHSTHCLQNPTPPSSPFLC